MRWFLLFIAIACDVTATSLLKSTEGFTRLWPCVAVVVFYETAFILLSLSMKKIPLGIVSAAWAGVGVTLISLVSWQFLGQPPDAVTLTGMALIVSGVVVIGVFSKSHSIGADARSRT
jgi:small multidrug resistance pump